MAVQMFLVQMYFCKTLKIRILRALLLVFRFECFRYIFFFGKLFYQPRKHFLCLPINVSKVTVHVTACQQIVLAHFAILFEIPQVSLSPYADMP